MGPGTLWMRYIDDVLIVIPRDMNLEDKVQNLNAVDAKIQFTVEKETNSGLPFLDTFIFRDGQEVQYKVYRKPSSKEDYIHYYSGHNKRYKTGIVIGFFLRAFRVCSPEFLEDEIIHIVDRFQQLRDPKGLLNSLQKKAFKLHGRASTEKEKPKKSLTWLCLQNFDKVDIIARYLERAGVKVVIGTGKKSGDVLKRKNRGTKDKDNSIVYSIPCAVCDKQYIGETGRGLKTRIAEHRRDMRNHVESNAMVAHADKEGHLPRWEQTNILEIGISKSIRKALEAAHIQSKDTTNTRTGFYTLAQPTARLALLRRGTTE